MDPCLANNVELWMANNCTERSLSSDQNFFSKLFEGFYGTHEGVFVQGVDEVTPDVLQFQDLLASVCNVGANGRYCRQPLLNTCSIYSRQDTENSTIRKLCGCYLPSDQYNKDLAVPCDTVCSSFGTVKYYEQGSINPEFCASSVCIIDGVTINLKNSSVGDITFNQLCPFCTGITECRCFISDINIITQNSSLGKVEINQNCGTNSVCSQRNPDGSTSNVSCESYFSTLGENPSVVEQKSKSYRWVFWTCLVVSILFLLALILGLYYLIQEPVPQEVVQTVKYYTTNDAGARVVL